VNLDIYTIDVEQFSNGTAVVVDACNASVNSSCHLYTSAQYLIGDLGSIIGEL